MSHQGHSHTPAPQGSRRQNFTPMHVSDHRFLFYTLLINYQSCSSSSLPPSSSISPSMEAHSWVSQAIASPNLPHLTGLESGVLFLPLQCLYLSASWITLLALPTVALGWPCRLFSGEHLGLRYHYNAFHVPQSSQQHNAPQTGLFTFWNMLIQSVPFPCWWVR